MMMISAVALEGLLKVPTFHVHTFLHWIQQRGANSCLVCTVLASVMSWNTSMHVLSISFRASQKSKDISQR